MEYNPPSLIPAPAHVPPIFVLAISDSRDDLHFFVNPEWPAIVQDEDSEYIESLLRDWVDRAGMQPEALFKQLSSLGVGPLLTREDGDDLSSNAAYAGLLSTFVEIK